MAIGVHDRGCRARLQGKHMKVRNSPGFPSEELLMVSSSCPDAPCTYILCILRPWSNPFKA